MERKESRFSPRARRLISKAVGLGIEPSRINAEMQAALNKSEGDQRVTRDRLFSLRLEINSIKKGDQING